MCSDLLTYRLLFRQQVTTHGHVILPQTLKQQSISQQVTTHEHVILPQTLKQQSISQQVTTHDLLTYRLLFQCLR
jgi:hypothetical protein